MYRATPHHVTGKSPAELMFGRKIRDIVPSASLCTSSIFNEEVRDRDIAKKLQGKEYADKRRNAIASDISTGDQVLAKIVRKENKLTPNFGSEEFTVQNKIGGDVIISSNENGSVYRRNVAHLKRIPASTEGSQNTLRSGYQQEAEVNEEARHSDDIRICSDDENNQTNENSSENTVIESNHSTDSLNRLNRPIRNRKPPEKFNDYEYELN